MSTAVLEVPATPPRRSRGDAVVDDTPELPRGAEYVDGEIVEKPMSELSNWVGKKLIIALDSYIESRSLGILFHGGGEQGYRCFPDDRKKVRKPDVSIVQRDLDLAGLSTQGYTTDVPYFVAEVVSPGDHYTDIRRKIDDYLGIGTRLIWIIDPELRSADVYKPGQPTITVTETGILTGDDVIPGFSLPLAEILPKKVPTMN